MINETYLTAIILNGPVPYTLTSPNRVAGLYWRRYCCRSLPSMAFIMKIEKVSTLKVKISLELSS